MADLNLENLIQEIEESSASNHSELEQYRIEYLGKKGKVKALFAKLKEVDEGARKALGAKINEVKNKAEAKLESLKASISSEKKSGGPEQDLSLPGVPLALGTRHPISIVRNTMTQIFQRIGFTVSEGPEIETDWNNFTALNMPEDHPARDMQDTFFIQTDPDILLRTHTSPQQIRVMESTEPPIRIICPGRVYRNETISARSHCIFHQIEGLYVDENVSFADLRQTLYYFAKEMFGEDTQIRFRPSYFPFTEPSAEMDISCLICKGDGCPVCKHSGWVEILGCGMVDPAVLENCNIDSEKYTGYAFGLGIERPAMLKYRIDDIRLFFENDMRFLEQFQSAI
ncbi:MAG: phenylalanine--tRNA ligase subunit alpha [Flavobacteriales bacterium]|nr:phenylalanine--tRNA ligase subunit alpha [Flavobacteriales bacterium]